MTRCCVIPDMILNGRMLHNHRGNFAQTNNNNKEKEKEPKSNRASLSNSNFLDTLRTGEHVNRHQEDIIKQILNKENAIKA